MAPHLITLSEAAEALKIERARAGSWLKVLVLRRERETGREILVRHGKQGTRRHYLVNMTNLRRYCPDLFDGRDDVLKAASALAKGTDSKLEALGDQIDEMDGKLAAILMTLRKMAGLRV
jgi:hypothetical protein